MKLKIIHTFFLFNLLVLSVSVAADDGQISIGLQYQNIENYFNQSPSSAYGEEVITAAGIKLEVIKPLSSSDKVTVFYGGGIGLLAGSYKVETTGPINGSGSLDFATGLNLFLEGQFNTSKKFQLVVRGGYAVNLYYLGAAEYSTAPTFDPYNEGVDEGSTEFFAAFGVQFIVDENHPIKILYRVTLGDFQSAWTDTSYDSNGTAVANTYTLSALEVSYGF